MALFKVDEFMTLGMDDEFTGADWQISRDKYFNDLIVNITEDMENVESLHIALRDPDTGKHIDGYDGVYGRVRYRYNHVPSPWCEAKACYADGKLNNDGDNQ